MRTLFLTLLTVAVALSGRAAESTIPKATAAHFCQLLVQDAEGRIKSLGAFANGDTTKRGWRVVSWSTKVL